MRKDTRIGVAIGLVLFAVLIVYAVVGAKTGKKKITLDKTGKTVAPVDDSSTGSAAPVESADAAAGGSAAGELKQETAAAGVNPANPADAADPHDRATAGADWAALLGATEKFSGPVRTHTPDMAPPKASDGLPSKVVEGTSGASRTLNTTTVANTGPDRSTAASATHRVEQGETYVSIARAVYGDSRYAEEIRKANPSVDPRRLRLGTVLHLPEKAGVVKGDSTSARPDRTVAKAVDASKEYAVQADDSLYKISVKLYGKGDKVDEIYELNKQTIGADRARLRPGMVLKLPQAPQTSVTTAAPIR